LDTSTTGVSCFIARHRHQIQFNIIWSTRQPKECQIASTALWVGGNRLTSGIKKVSVVLLTALTYATIDQHWTWSHGGRSIKISPLATGNTRKLQNPKLACTALDARNSSWPIFFLQSDRSYLIHRRADYHHALQNS